MHPYIFAYSLGCEILAGFRTYVTKLILGLYHSCHKRIRSSAISYVECSDCVYVKSLGVLVGGTPSGKVGMWKFVSDLTCGGSSSEHCWKPQPPIILNRPVTSLSVRLFAAVYTRWSVKYAPVDFRL